MKLPKATVAALLITSYLAAPFAALAVDTPTSNDPAKKTEKVKPYLLKTCIVSDEKLGGDMGEPYVFNYKGQEYKLCCKDCRKDFDKAPAKYMKKLADAEKKAAEKPEGKPADKSPAK
jgi:hypothetical protein